MKKRVAVLGATGSIGKSALDVLRADTDQFEPVLFSSHRDLAGLLSLSREFPAAVLALTGAPAGNIAPQDVPDGVYRGSAGLLRAIGEANADIAVNGIAGAAGLEPSLACLEAGFDLALANKETVVMAGKLVFALAKKRGKKILPVDSEHSAIFSLLEAQGAENLAEILLTASGGPFRTLSREQLAAITPRDALKHPTWNMGPKITIDSASLANKGLEVIEAVGLFGVKPDQITVVVHPQSIVHSMIRLKNGVVYAELSKPDMRLPIHNALYYPDCAPCSFGRLEFDSLTLGFEKPDGKKFRMLPLAYEAARAGGLYPAVYNAANEAAVGAFLVNTAGFLDIPRIVEYVLSTDWNRDLDATGNREKAEALEAILEADRRARKLAEAYILKIMEKK
jgi:1-deoxy-D-xylulose-5-phosphate reductoisomerase